MEYAYYFQPSLECLSIVSSVWQLLKQKDSREAIDICMLTDLRDDYETNRSKIEELCKTQWICRTVTNDMLLTVQLMLNSIKEFLNWGDYYFDEIPSEIFFQASRLTNVGTIDKKKSVEEILKNEIVNIEVRFKLACFSCLETYVKDIWSMLNVEERERLEILSEHESDMYLLKYWIDKIKTGESEKNYFKKSVLNDHQLAMVFFWEKFSVAKKRYILNRCEMNDYDDVGLECAHRYVKFLLLAFVPYVEKEQRIKWIISNIERLVEILQDPPWGLFYKSVVKKLLEWIGVTNYATYIIALSNSEMNNNFRQELFCDFTSSYLPQVTLDGNRQLVYAVITEHLIHYRFKEAIEFFKRQHFDDSILFTVEFVQRCCSLYLRDRCKDFPILDGIIMIFIGKCVENKEKRVEWIDKFVQEAQDDDVIPISAEGFKKRCMHYMALSEAPFDEIFSLLKENYVPVLSQE